MLEYNHCINYIGDIKDFFIVLYTIIDDLYTNIVPKHIQNRRNKAKATMSDSEIITITVLGELHSIDSENAWYSYCKRNYRDLFPNFCDRTRFNRTRRGLHSTINEIRKGLSNIMSLPQSPYRIVDSIPCSSMQIW